MDRVADADAAAVMDRNPARAASGVGERIQKRPIGDGVRPVLHSLGLAIRRGDRAAIEVIAADNEGGFDLPRLHELIEALAHQGAFAVFQPANAGRQSLKLHLLPCQYYPATERFVVWKGLEHGIIGGGDVGGVARKRRPAERPGTLAEKRTDVLGHETRNLKRFAHSAAIGDLAAEVVAVIEHSRA